MTSETELHTLVEKTFPTWGEQTSSRLEALGTYLASAWPAGASALRSRGINVTDTLHARLLQGAQHVASTRKDGAKFLVHLRSGVADDGQFTYEVQATA